MSRIGKVADYIERGRNRLQRIGVANQGQHLGARRWGPNGPEGVIGHEKGNNFRIIRKRNKSFHKPQKVTKSPFTEHKRNNKEPLTQDGKGRVTKIYFQSCGQRKARSGMSFERAFTFPSG